MIYKFRAWNRSDLLAGHKLKFVQRTIDEELYFCLENDEEFRYSFSSVFEDDNWIVEQFTGVHDCNETEIYLGDIVRHDVMGIQEVVFSCGRFQLKIGTHFNEYARYEVMGNKYEYI